MKAENINNFFGSKIGQLREAAKYMISCNFPYLEVWIAFTSWKIILRHLHMLLEIKECDILISSSSTYEPKVTDQKS